MKTLSPMDQLPPFSHEDYLRVLQATEQSDKVEPRIAHVSYNSRTRQLHLKLRDGVSAAIPIDLFDEFAGVAPKQIANCQIRENGASLHWDELDVQMTTIAILQIAFKFTTVSDNARRAGSSRTSAKSAAARRNGAKGGRPRKTVAA